MFAPRKPNATLPRTCPWHDETSRDAHISSALNSYQHAQNTVDDPEASTDQAYMAAEIQQDAVIQARNTAYHDVKAAGKNAEESFANPFRDSPLAEAYEEAYAIRVYEEEVEAKIAAIRTRLQAAEQEHDDADRPRP